MKLDYGNKIKYFRKRAGISQLQLEVLINASFGSISRIENGLTNPTKETLFAIANALRLNSLETINLFGITLEDKGLDFINLQFDNTYQV